MLRTRTEVKKLLDDNELDLFDAGRDDGLKRLDGREARAKLEKARRLRDRYRQGDGNMSAKEKASVFDELVARFQKRLEHISQIERRAREGADRLIAAQPKPARKARSAGAEAAKADVPPQAAKNPAQPARSARAKARAETDKLQGDPLTRAVPAKSATRPRSAATSHSESAKLQGDPIRVRLGRKAKT
jgi:hypothetical protein